MTVIMPREKLLQEGAGALNDAELVAIFLRTGVRGTHVMDLAEQLLVHYTGLRGLMLAEPSDLLQQHGIGPATFAQLASALEMSKRYLHSGLERGISITDPQMMRDYLLMKMKDLQREVFVCLFLDNQHRLLKYEEMFYGTIDGASVHPREVVRRALELNAAAVIFAHNHPSGVAEPSAADKRITERLISALGLVDIRALDHLIVADTTVLSFAEQGLL